MSLCKSLNGKVAKRVVEFGDLPPRVIIHEILSRVWINIRRPNMKEFDLFGYFKKDGLRHLWFLFSSIYSGGKYDKEIDSSDPVLLDFERLEHFEFVGHPFELCDLTKFEFNRRLNAYRLRRTSFQRYFIAHLKGARFNRLKTFSAICADPTLFLIDNKMPKLENLHIIDLYNPGKKNMDYDLKRETRNKMGLIFSMEDLDDEYVKHDDLDVRFWIHRIPESVWRQLNVLTLQGQIYSEFKAFSREKACLQNLTELYLEFLCENTEYDIVNSAVIHFWLPNLEVLYFDQVNNIRLEVGSKLKIFDGVISCDSMCGLVGRKPPYKVKKEYEELLKRSKELTHLKLFFKKHYCRDCEHDYEMEGLFEELYNPLENLKSLELTRFMRIPNEECEPTPFSWIRKNRTGTIGQDQLKKICMRQCHIDWNIFEYHPLPNLEIFVIEDCQISNLKHHHQQVTVPFGENVKKIRLHNIKTTDEFYEHRFPIDTFFQVNEFPKLNDLSVIDIKNQRSTNKKWMTGENWLELSTIKVKRIEFCGAHVHDTFFSSRSSSLCIGLSKIVLSQCSNVTGEWKCRFSNLKTMKICHCDRMNDSLFTSNEFPTIRQLYLLNCPRITGEKWTENRSIGFMNLKRLVLIKLSSFRRDIFQNRRTTIHPFSNQHTSSSNLLQGHILQNLEELYVIGISELSAPVDWVKMENLRKFHVGRDVQNDEDDDTNDILLEEFMKNPPFCEEKCELITLKDVTMSKWFKMYLRNESQRSSVSTMSVL